MAKKGSTTGDSTGIRAWIQAQPKTQRAALRTALSDLRKLFKSPQHDDLCWWHQVGERVLALQPKGQRRYGDNVVELLADYLDPGRQWEDKRIPNLLYRTRAFAEKYAWREAQELDRQRRAGHLTTLHIVALLSLEDKGLRKTFLKRCLKESWSGLRLRREIQNKVGRKRSSGGLSPTPPENPSPRIALRDLSILARRWMTNYEVWFVGQRAPLSREELKACDAATLKEVKTAIQRMDEVQHAAAQGTRRLKSVAKAMKARLETANQASGTSGKLASATPVPSPRKRNRRTASSSKGGG